MSRILLYLKRTLFLNKKRYHQCSESKLICSEIAFAEFWFYAKKEDDLYQLASQLSHNGYKITVCEPMEEIGGYFCLALSKIDPEPERFDRLVIELKILAKLHNCKLDGWLRS